MDAAESQTSPDQVVLYHGEECNGIEQPRTFRVCRKGLQLYSPREVPLFQLVEFTLDFPAAEGGSEQHCCTGSVVQCEFEEDIRLYRIVVAFQDVPEPARQRIDALPPPIEESCRSLENF